MSLLGSRLVSVAALELNFILKLCTYQLWEKSIVSYVLLAQLVTAFLLILCSLPYNLWSARTVLQNTRLAESKSANMEVGTALTIVMILWAGDLVLGAPNNGAALEWAFGGDFRIVTLNLETICKTLCWGGWFARSSRGVYGSYLTSDFKGDIETLMGQISRKGMYTWLII